MKSLLSMAEALALDADVSARLGLSPDLLMESAARIMAERLLSLYPQKLLPGSPVVALCGPGNNAGDALAILRMLAMRGLSCSALLSPKRGPAAEARLLEATKAGVRALPWDCPEAEAALSGASIALDGICGAGLREAPRPPLDAMISLLSRASCPVVAIDLPSGIRPYAAGEAPLGPDSGKPATVELTLSVAPVKTELYYPANRPFAGTIEPVEGVFPSACQGSAQLLAATDLARLLPPLPPDAHKGTRGSLAVYGGSDGGLGAGLLSAKAGSASGAGVVSLVVRDGLWPVAAASLVSQVVRRESDGPGRKADAVLLGPGWGRGADRQAILEGWWRSDQPLALDADALVPACGLGRRPTGAPLVLTPHPGECLALAAAATGQDEPTLRERLARDTAALGRTIAAHFGAVVVLKNSVSWIFHPEGQAAVWDGRVPELATGGSGDVLAGLLAGFLARGIPAWDAARAAVIVHGLAGAAAAAERGFFEAADLIPYIARAAREG